MMISTMNSNLRFSGSYWLNITRQPDPYKGALSYAEIEAVRIQLKAMAKARGIQAVMLDKRKVDEHISNRPEQAAGLFLEDTVDVQPARSASDEPEITDWANLYTLTRPESDATLYQAEDRIHSILAHSVLANHQGDNRSGWPLVRWVANQFHNELEKIAPALNISKDQFGSITPFTLQPKVEALLKPYQAIVASGADRETLIDNLYLERFKPTLQKFAQKAKRLDVVIDSQGRIVSRTYQD
jgi:hypothetical protein